MQVSEEMTAAKAAKEIETREAERERVEARARATSPGGPPVQLGDRQVYPAYSFPQGDEYRAALESDDPAELVSVQDEHAVSVARLRQLDAQLEPLREREKEAELEARRKDAPKEIAKRSRAIEKKAGEVQTLEAKLLEARNAVKRDADAVADLRKLLGDGAPGITPEALRGFWLVKWGADDKGRVKWRGSAQGTIRDVLLQEVIRYMEPPRKEAEKLAKEWDKAGHNPRRGQQMEGSALKNRREQFERELQEKRVQMIADGALD